MTRPRMSKVTSRVKKAMQDPIIAFAVIFTVSSAVGLVASVFTASVLLGCAP